MTTTTPSPTFSQRRQGYFDSWNVHVKEAWLKLAYAISRFEAEGILNRIPWRKPCTCPRCGEKAWYSVVFGNTNTEGGSRIFCPHCGYNCLRERSNVLPKC